MASAFEYLLWISVAIVILVTIGYPLFLFCTASLVRSRLTDESLEPSVTMVIAAYNEEAVIAAKLENCLQLDYPADKIEFVVASDGSADRTNDIVRAHADRRVVLADFPRTGKTGVQNLMAQRPGGEILIFSDANAMYRRDALRKLVRNFADPSVGGVCGELIYTADEAGAGHSESVYWTYEKFMKCRESDLSSVVGANGSIYAVRRSDYVTIDNDLISDFVEPLAIVRAGKRVVYEPEAVSVEAASTNYGTEFRRKVRILTRSIRGLLRMRGLMNPRRHGIFAVQLVMHKLLRFITPLFLATAGLALLALVALGRYWALFGAAAITVALAIAVAGRQGSRPTSTAARVLHLVYYYLMANYALVLAWLNVLRGQRMVLWVPERPQQ